MISKKLEINEIQQISIEVLKFVTDICDKENIKYFLAYGTLIGAVRHKGFIPWDDDVDILVPRNDYDRLINYFYLNAEKLLPYRLFGPDTPNYPYMISRIGDVRYPIKVRNEKPYGLGVFIDVIPLDGLGNDYKDAIKVARSAKRYSSLYFLSTRKSFSRDNTKSNIKLLLKFPAYLISKILGKNYIKKKLYNLSKLYNYDDSKYITCVVWSTYGQKEIYERDSFAEAIKVKFERYYFNIPKDYDKILKGLYGDYMMLPEEEDRVAHHLYDVFMECNGKDYE